MVQIGHVAGGRTNPGWRSNADMRHALEAFVSTLVIRTRLLALLLSTPLLAVPLRHAPRPGIDATPAAHRPIPACANRRPPACTLDPSHRGGSAKEPSFGFLSPASEQRKHLRRESVPGAEEIGREYFRFRTRSDFSQHPLALQ